MILTLFIGFKGAKSNESRVSKFNIPEREVAIVATEDGFFPEILTVFKGEKVRIFLTSTTDKPNCLMIPTKDIFMSGNKGKLTEATLYFDSSGVVKFNCPSSNISGQFIVLKKKFSAKGDARNIASLKKGSKVKIWLPREE